MKVVKIVAYILTLIGALNWGLVGLFKFDLYRRSLVVLPPTTQEPFRIIYVVVAIAALYLLTLYDRITRDD